MIVDDEKAIRESLPFAVDFEKYGYQVCATARNGEDALKKWEEMRPDVILLDVCMPVLDGLGFLRALQERGEELPCIVMLSGYSDFEYARTAIRYGVTAWLTKPLEEEELIHILEEVRTKLDSRSQNQRNQALAVLSASLQKMYHDGDGDRSPYKDYLVVHFVVLKSGTDGEGYSFLRECIERHIPGGDAAYVRSRGSVISYLLHSEHLEEYQFSVTLFARHLLYQIEKTGVECALLLDEALFAGGEGTFRKDFDVHLYQMMTEVFWDREHIVRNRENGERRNWEKRLEQEDRRLGRLKTALEEQDEERWQSVFEEMTENAKELRLNMLYIQEINYRIYYLLSDLLQKEGEEKPEQTPHPLEWRESPVFMCCDEWKRKLREQINGVFLWLERIREEKNPGITDQAIEYIRRNFRNQLALKEVTERFYVSPSYLGRCLQKATGMGFRQYVNELRIEEAKRLLTQTDSLIYEIAEEVGFRESKYFISRFTAEMGMSPMEYKRKGQHLQKEQ